jgi:hypothetical protein
VAPGQLWSAGLLWSWASVEVPIDCSYKLLWTSTYVYRRKLEAQFYRQFRSPYFYEDFNYPANASQRPRYLFAALPKVHSPLACACDLQNTFGVVNSSHAVWSAWDSVLSQLTVTINHTVTHLRPNVKAVEDYSLPNCYVVGHTSFLGPCKQSGAQHNYTSAILFPDKGGFARGCYALLTFPDCATRGGTLDASGLEG